MTTIDEYGRAEFILAELETGGRVSVGDLVERLGVSAVTIRKDLETLEQRTMLRRVRGGAVSTVTADEGSFEMRLRQQRAAKQAIAGAAAELVGHDDVIALDGSTTCYYLAQALLDRRALTVVTNGLRTATLFLERSTAMVVMPGGVLRRPSGSMVGPLGDVLAARGTIDRGFFGVKGLSVVHGLLDLAIEEAEAKKYIARSCAEVYGLFDAGKVGRFGLHSFAPTTSITALYTTDRMRPEDAADWAAAGVPVRRIHAPDDDPRPGN